MPGEAFILASGQGNKETEPIPFNQEMGFPNFRAIISSEDRIWARVSDRKRMIANQGKKSNGIFSATPFSSS
jgi:hypothetical protein